MKYKLITSLALLSLLMLSKGSVTNAATEDAIKKAEQAVASSGVFEERLPVYGVIKPDEMTTLLAVNHGMVTKLNFDIGDKVKFGSGILRIIEREMTRSYRSTINGRVAKIHVTSGAAVTPGMPLVTIINPKKKKIEVSFSPEEAKIVKLDSNVYTRGSSELFGKIIKISPLVDPDTGAVTSFIKPIKKVEQLIGDVLPLEVSLRKIDGCTIVPIKEIDQHIEGKKVFATSGLDACLK